MSVCLSVCPSEVFAVVESRKRRPFKCYVCFASFTGRTQLVLHQIDTHNSKRKSTTKNFRYHCTKCGDHFMRSYDVKKHMMKVHPGMRLVLVKSQKKTRYQYHNTRTASLRWKAADTNDDKQRYKQRYKLRRATRNSRNSVIHGRVTLLVILYSSAKQLIMLFDSTHPVSKP
jgi:hypothetical protein